MLTKPGKEFLEGLIHKVEVTTDQMVRHALSCLPPLQDGDEALGVVADPFIHRTWALAFEYDRRSALALHSAHFDTETAEQREQLNREAHYLDEMGDLMRSIVWLMVDELIPMDSEVGFREGFVLVRTKRDSRFQIGGLLINEMLEKLRVKSEERKLRERKPQ